MRNEEGSNVIVLALLVTGLAAGILGALLGLGGGIFLVPALTILFGLPIRMGSGQTDSNGTGANSRRIGFRTDR